MVKAIPPAKFIFVTGGVCSGLGKGIAAASVGALLKASGYSVFSLKMDPYLNVDPGTMSPYQHGEVFVTDDGAETDLDLGHYERFLDTPLTKLSNLTTGQLYSSLLGAERAGKFLGKTVQVVPHVTEAIKDYIRRGQETSACDVMIIEIGGTVGDIEGQPYLEAARQFRREMGEENTLFIHVTLVPYLAASKELKTKPTQASVRELKSYGIQPDLIVARSDYRLDQATLDKIALFCDVEAEAVIPAVTESTIYAVPLGFADKNIHRIISRKLRLAECSPDLKEWKQLVVELKRRGKRTVKIAMTGKYTEHGDAYLSVLEALKAAGVDNKVGITVEWIDAEKLERKDKEEWRKLRSCDGIVVPGGFGSRGAEGKIQAITYAIEHKVPYLGLCFGMQLATIAYARKVLKDNSLTSEEFGGEKNKQVIHYLPGQHDSVSKGGTMRLGTYPCLLRAGTKSRSAYGKREITERHRHRYEFNNNFRKLLEQKDLVVAGTSPDSKLVEIIELKNHPWFVATQFHPEFKSRPLKPHPLFREFIKAVKKRKTN
ncbi:MAG: CTP synthase [bacterium]